MALLTILGLALRLVWFNRYQLAGTDCDGAGYMDVARHIASGAGFTTNVYKYLYLPPASLPQPDAHWNPLYPLLTAGAFRLFGESMFSAKLVPLLLGTAVPALVHRLGQALTGDRRAALVAGLLAVAHPVLVTWSLRIETEIGTLALVTAVLVLMFRPGWQGSVALGVVTGLAWWMKYQSALLWGAILLQAAIMRPPRRGLRGLAIVALAFTVTISPWLVRNQRVFGDPFHTDLRTDVISDYAGLGGRNRVWASLTPPPKPIPYLLAHGSETLRHVYANLVGFARDLPREASGSVLLVPLGLVGVLAEARRWRNWAPPVFYGALLFGLFAVSTAHTRYLYSVIPIAIVLSASGVAWLAGRAAALPRAPAAALRVLLVLGVGVAIADEVRTAAAAATDRRSVWTPAANCCVLEHQAAAAFVREHTGPRDAVMSAEPYHAGYLFDRPAVNLPFDERSIPPLAAKYGIRYLVVADRARAVRLPGWSQGPPSWARVVARWTPGEIARESGATAYPHLSPVTVYELDVPRPTGGAHVP